MMKTPEKISKRLLPKSSALFACVVAFGVVMIGCSGGGGSSTGGANDDSSMVNSGKFKDSPVEGLFYQTATQSGMTGKDGTFAYMDGEMVAFYVGGLKIGEAEGSSVMTPIDLVTGAVDETNMAVTNICRLLQTLDIDEDPENGITITPDTSDTITVSSMTFMMNFDDFEHQTNMVQMMESLMGVTGFENGRTMVSSEQAQAHMKSTMMNMGNMRDHMMTDEDSNSSGST